MKQKISFQEKNNLIVKYKNENFFYKDLELFKHHFPSDQLNNELARANSFSYARLDGLMMYKLLDLVSIDEILENRKEKKFLPVTDDQTIQEPDSLEIEQPQEKANTMDPIGNDNIQDVKSDDQTIQGENTRTANKKKDKSTKNFLK